MTLSGYFTFLNDSMDSVEAADKNPKASESTGHRFKSLTPVIPTSFSCFCISAIVIPGIVFAYIVWVSVGEHSEH